MPKFRFWYLLLLMTFLVLYRAHPAPVKAQTDVCDDLYQAFDMHASLQAGRGLVDGKMRLQHTCGYPVVPFLLQDKTFVEFYGLSGDLLARVGISDIQSIAQAETGAKRAFTGYAERPSLEIVNRRDLGMMLVVSPERGDSLFCWGLGFEAGCPYSTATPTSTITLTPTRTLTPTITLTPSRTPFGTAPIVASNTPKVIALQFTPVASATASVSAPSPTNTVAVPTATITVISAFLKTETPSAGQAAGGTSDSNSTDVAWWCGLLGWLLPAQCGR